MIVNVEAIPPITGGFSVPPSTSRLWHDMILKAGIMLQMSTRTDSDERIPKATRMIRPVTGMVVSTGVPTATREANHISLLCIPNSLRNTIV